MRGVLAVLYLIFVIVHMWLIGSEFFWYLTNWTLLTIWLTYCLLFVASYKHHRHLASPSAQTELASDRSFCGPWQLHKWCIILFQTAFTISFLIMLVYWCFLFPKFLKACKLLTDEFEGKTREEATIELVVISLDHLHPMLFLVTEWLHNHIKFETRQFSVILLILLMYGGFNYYLTMKMQVPAYWTNDWVNYPIFALLFNLFLLFLIFGVFTASLHLTEAKLMRYQWKAEIKQSKEARLLIAKTDNGDQK